MRLNRLCLCVCAISLAASTVCAQSVWPQGYASRAGGSTKSTPFSISKGLTPARTRTVVAIDAASLPFASGYKINGIAFRRDVSASPYSGYSATIQVRISAVPDAEMLTGAAHTIFDQSHEVFRGAIAVPNASPPGTGPAPFALRIPFSTAWTYPGGDLAVEISVTGPVGSVWRCDAVDLGFSDGGRVRSLGGGCPTSQGDRPPLLVRDASTIHPAGEIEYVHDRLPLPPQGVASLFFLGVTSPPLGLGSSFDPSCRLYVFPIVFNLVGLFGNRFVNYARGGLRIPVPNSASLAGVKLAGQALCVDFALTSAMPISLSQAIEVEVGMAHPPAIPFIGRSFWVHGSRLPGEVQGLRVGPVNHVPVMEFF